MQIKLELHCEQFPSYFLKNFVRIISEASCIQLVQKLDYQKSSFKGLNKMTFIVRFALFRGISI